MTRSPDRLVVLSCFRRWRCLPRGARPWPQDFRGAITGRITDTSNAVLPGATVTATNTDTNQATTTSPTPTASTTSCT